MGSPVRSSSSARSFSSAAAGREAGDADTLDLGVARRLVACIEVDAAPRHADEQAQAQDGEAGDLRAQLLRHRRHTSPANRSVSNPPGSVGPGVPFAMRKNSVPQISLPLLFASAKNGPSTAIWVRCARIASIFAPT